MRRNLLTIPAAAIVMLSGFAGLSPHPAPAQARPANDTSFSGTITISDYQVPNALGAGNAGTSVVNQQLIAATTDGVLTFDQHGNFYPDLATEVPTSKNGGVKVVNGDEIITYHLKPNQRWSDGSPVVTADWIIGFLLDFSPDVSTVDPFNKIRTAALSGNQLTLHLNGVLGSAVQQFISLLTPSPAAYYQKKYGVTLPASMLTSWDYAKETDAKTGLIPQSVYASSGLKTMANAWLQDHYTSPNDVFNGPYKVGEWSPDQRYVLVANPYYTALPTAANHPRPARIQFVVISEDGPTYIQDLKAGSTYGNIDKAEDFTPDNISDLHQSKYQVIAQPGLSYELLDLMVGPTFNGQPNPLHDVRVRQALQYAIDKFAYLKALFPDFDPHQLALSSFIPASSPWSINKDLPLNPYDPARARALLAAAGYATTPGTGGNHLNLDFVTTTKTSRIKGSQLLQRLWSQVGINIKIRFVQAHGVNGLFSTWQDGGIQARHTFQISLHGYETNPDPDEGYLNWAPDQISTASNPNGANVDYVNDTKLTDLFLRGRNSLDSAERQRLYAAAQHYVYDQAINISLYTVPKIVVVKGTIGNFKPNPTQTGYQWNSWEWWFDKNNAQKALLN